MLTVLKYKETNWSKTATKVNSNDNHGGFPSLTQKTPSAPIQRSTPDHNPCTYMNILNYKGATQL